MCRRFSRLFACADPRSDRSTNRPAVLGPAIAVVLVILLVLAASAGPLRAGDLLVLDDDRVTVLFEPRLEQAARDLVALYPAVVRGLEDTFGWPFDLRPTVLLVGDPELFRSHVGGGRVVAYAVPRTNLVVIDHGKVVVRPFTMEITLKHELCHLLLHRHIPHAVLPLWLEEGVCQWVSDGIGELMVEGGASRLAGASLRGRFIPLRALAGAFPGDDESLALAYEQSKSFVSYAVGRFGKDRMLRVLERMRSGDDADTAMGAVFSVGRDSLETEWRRWVKRNLTWFTYFSVHMYEILFAAAAVCVVIGFIRLMRRKRAYDDEPGTPNQGDEP